MARHGLEKRNPSQLHLVANPSSRHMIKYLDYIQLRLNHLVYRPEEFWQFAQMIARRSSVFKSMMFREVLPRFHRECNMKELYLLMNHYNLYWETLPVALKYRRVYIPKAKDPETNKTIKWRPLGVPTVAWRIYLHSWQQFLMIFLRDRISQHQHGFYKGRGTKTAWEEVLSKVIHAPDIIEFDLKGFFPSVDVRESITLLEKEYGLPSNLGANLLWMGQSPAVLPPPDAMEFPEHNGYPLNEDITLDKWELQAMGQLHDPSNYVNKKGRPVWEKFLELETWKSENSTVDFWTDMESHLLSSSTSAIASETAPNSIESTTLPDHMFGGSNISLKAMLDASILLENVRDNTLCAAHPEVAESAAASADLISAERSAAAEALANASAPSSEESLASALKDAELLSSDDETIIAEAVRLGLMLDPKESASLSASIPQSSEPLKGLSEGTFYEKYGRTFGSYHAGAPKSSFVGSQCNRFVGFPQGSPISPLLCSMILQGTVFAIAENPNLLDCKITMYADDGLFYGKNLSETILETTESMKQYNLSFAREKSGWIKKDGVWLKPLKYLGLIYDPFAREGLGELRAATRKGATLTFDKYKLIQELTAKYLPPVLDEAVKSLSSTDDTTTFYESVSELRQHQYYNSCLQSIKNKWYESFALSDSDSDFYSRFTEYYWWLYYSDYYTILLTTANERGSWLESLDEFIINLEDQEGINDIVVEKTVPGRNKYVKRVLNLKPFSWQSLLNSKQFGFIQSRLYNNAWNSKVPQDFTFKYKPGSWSWYAQLSFADQTLSSLLNPQNWSTHNSWNLVSPKPIIGLGPTVKLDQSQRYFNQDVIKHYGYNVVDIDPNTGSQFVTFNRISKKEFLRLFRTPLQKLSLDDQLAQKALCVKQYRKSSAKYAINNKAFLTVFNSSSYAVPCLVNIFRIQNKLINWRKVFMKLGLSGLSLMKALRAIRLGFHPETLCKSLIFNPHLLDHVPDPIAYAEVQTPDRFNPYNRNKLT